MASIKVTTGLKVYDIEDEKGNIRGQISFNPADMNFFARAQNTKKVIEESVKEYMTIYESKSEEEILDKMNRVDFAIKEELNRLFDDPNTSKVIFGNQNCLNTLNGVTFVERFLLAFAPVIQADFKAEKTKSNKRIEKYTKQVK